MILHLTRELLKEPQAVSTKCFAIRAVRIPGDVTRWLSLRENATAEMRPMPGPWSESDFAREFTAQKWFRADRMWVAEANEMTETHPDDDKILSGSVTLIPRPGIEKNGPTARVHWLLVHPDRRRKASGER
ncbi:MAG: hypothetical protein WD875_17370 [Pirellulales bacterium]